MHTYTDKNLLQLKQNIYIKTNCNYLIKRVTIQLIICLQCVTFTNGMDSFQASKI